MFLQKQKLNLTTNIYADFFLTKNDTVSSNPSFNILIVLFKKVVPSSKLSGWNLTFAS